MHAPSVITQRIRFAYHAVTTRLIRADLPPRSATRKRLEADFSPFGGHAADRFERDGRAVVPDTRRKRSRLQRGVMAKRHCRPSAQYRYERYDPFVNLNGWCAER